LRRAHQISRKLNGGLLAELPIIEILSLIDAATKELADLLLDEERSLILGHALSGNKEAIQAACHSNKLLLKIVDRLVDLRGIHLGRLWKGHRGVLPWGASVAEHVLKGSGPGVSFGQKVALQVKHLLQRGRERGSLVFT